MIELFKIGKTIIETLNDNGFEAFFVGGCVRDYYMNREIHDVDITTNANPEKVEMLFPKTIDVGKEHGTVIVLMENIPFEVTTYRTEGEYTNHRHPDQVIFTNHLNEDLKRRDFTMNAMAMSHDMDFHDPFSGRDSIEKKEIITVGHSNERFSEDALRMVRAVRFMSVLNFSIEASTEESIDLYAHTLEHVSVERIVVEFKKIYNGIGVKEAKEKLVQTKLIQYIPFFKHIKYQNYLNAHVQDFTDELIIQTIKDNSLNDAIKDLKLSNDEKSTIQNCQLLFASVKNNDDVRNIAYQYDEDVIERLIKINTDNQLMEDSFVLSEALNLQSTLVIRSKKDLEIDGRHLMELYNTRSGPWIKVCLNIVENEVLFERLNNNHYDIINWVKQHVEVRSGSIKIIK